MWLSFDRFGRNFLFGRIPGSNPDKNQQQVNFVSIHNIDVIPANPNDHVRTNLPAIDNSELVLNSNAFNVEKEINTVDANYFRVTGEEDKHALKTLR